MGKRGPPRTPSRILEARGSALVGRNDREPVGELSAPPIPKGLTTEARAIWREVVPRLEGMQILCLSDASALETSCETFALWRKARDEVHAAPLVNEDGLGRSPQLISFLSIQESLLRIEKQFGLTPSARSSVEAGVQNWQQLAAAGAKKARAKGKRAKAKPQILKIS